MQGGTILFGLLFALVAGWNLREGLKDGGEFHARRPFSPITLKHPMFWPTAATHAALVLAGVYFVLCGLTGLKPFAGL